MSQPSLDPAAWLLAAADALNRHGSWTGRIHIHKHLFITQVLNLAAPPFEFVLYDYGPYSFDLDEKIIELELFGFLNRSYPTPGYGPRYEATLEGLKLAEGLKAEDRRAVERVAERIGNRNSQRLELIATCLWMLHVERVSDPKELVDQVRRVKPKYDEQAIRESLTDAQGVAEALAA